jgi:glycosyltransferase involved in cell wall biosynthesis
MVINIFHYHLNPGGVTRIIESQVSSLKMKDPAPEVRVFCGSAPETDLLGSLGVEVIEFEPLNYLEQKSYSKAELSEKYHEIHSFFHNKVEKGEIIHFHNLNLGKNPIITMAVYSLAKEGYPVFNHAHDFAEDRPDNWGFLASVIEGGFGYNLKDVLYPDLPHYLFGTLNGADLARLSEEGIPETSKFLLPNPVTAFTKDELPGKEKARAALSEKLNIDEQRRIVTYPVRVIERKNIGEFILLSVLLSGDAQFMVTLPPKNPIRLKAYEAWRSFCNEEGIDIIFEAGLQAGFLEILQGSDFCITTSSREGFGMVFLEPWMAGTPVIGRNLPSVTTDLRNAGVWFSMLYDELIIPGTSKDFKDLGDEEQRKVIRKGKESADYRKELKKANQWIDRILDEVPREKINKNIDCIKRNFSLEEYGDKLVRIYQRLTSKP